jgi:FAD/FMN-containing dehydrogenase
MVELKVTTLTGQDVAIEDSMIEEFRASLGGQLFCPDDRGYEEARKIWNGMIEKRPALIARCTGVADVINSVKFARGNNLLAAVRGGGHSFPGNSVCDGGLVIDLSPMKGIRVDPKKRTARAEAGVKWGEFDRETQAFELATTGGTVMDTGIAGLTLGGGIGWLCRKLGLVVDNLLSADVVTADGRFLTASAEENQELFWGLRGGSGNFGIVTSFEYQLHPVSTLLAGMVIYPMEKAREALTFYHRFASAAPDELMTGAGFLTSPEGQHVFVVLVCYNGPMDQGEQVLRPLREFGPPIADLIAPMPYAQVQNLLSEETFPSGRRNYIKTNFMDTIDDDAAAVLVERFEGVPSPSSVAAVFQLGGAVGRVGKEDTAFFHRDAGYHFFIGSMWEDPAEDEENIRWARETWSAMERFSSNGVYVNEMGDEQESLDRIAEAYGANTYERLVALKNKYDPDNFFRLNPNIKPKA